jgi:hypothetical protein
VAAAETAAPQFGPAALAAGLRALGYDVHDANTPATLQGHQLLRIQYRIRFGAHAGETCTIAFIAPPDFPASSPGGIYVHPSLRPLNQNGTLPHGGVTDASGIFGEQGWQYWSRPHDSWAQSERDTKAWMAHVQLLGSTWRFLRTRCVIRTQASRSMPVSQSSSSRGSWGRP